MRGNGAKAKAVFLDRDGVINELIYYSEQGIIDSPFTPEQFRLLPTVSDAIKKFHKMGYKLVLVSNQPGIAKGFMSADTFQELRDKMKRELAEGGASLDAEYYCLHHLDAKVAELRTNCECRKPKPGLLLQAAKEMGIDLSQSWMVGDNLTDIKAGKKAGTRTILIGRMKCELCRLMEEDGARPDAVCSNLLEAAEKVKINTNLINKSKINKH